MSKLNLVGLLAACILSCAFQAKAREGADMNTLLTHTHTPTHILGLKPIPNSYQLAKATFLPELTDSENGWSGNKISNSANKGNNCSGYELTTCPAHGTCSSCPFDRRYKTLISCANGYTKNDNRCKAASCSAIGYRSDIPANQICSKIDEDDLTCYKDCRAVSCAGFSLNCDTFNVANSAGKTMCPDCNSANSNCSPKLCKVSSCMSGYKIADNGTTCVPLDDNCPADYFKSCETGTLGDPKYTEAGNACWQCKPKIQTCAQYIAANRTDLTIINSFADLQHALIDNKNNFVLTNNLSVTAGINLSGKKIIGQNSITESPLCSKMTRPKLTVVETITTNDSTIVENLDFINAMTAEGNYDNLIPMIKGGGKFTSVNMSLDPGIYMYEINSYKPLMMVQETLTLKDVTATAMNAFDIASNAKLNLQGTITRICNTPEDRGGGFRGGAFLVSNNNTTINLEESATLTVLTPNKTLGFRAFVDWGEKNTVNINGKITFASGKYGAELTLGKGGIININYPITVAELSSNGGTININAATTINAETPESSITAIVIYNTGRLNVNAPVNINNFRVDNYSNAVEASYIYVNSTMTFNRSNSIKTNTLDITSKGRVIGATKR